MTNSKKLELATSIIVAAFENSSSHYIDLLEFAPKYLESIFNKIDELDKKDSREIQNIDTEPNNLI